MPIEKSEALVLRVIPFGDTSRILTLLTREFGLQKAIAKGVRSARPRYGGALELFARSELVLYRRRERELHLVGGADLVEAHLALAGELGRYAFASAIVEFIPKVVAGELDASGGAASLFEEALAALRLCTEAPVVTLPYLLRAFQLRFVTRLGHAPELERCLECGTPIEPGEGRVYFSAALGGVLCRRCGADAAGSVVLSAAALSVLRAYRDHDLVVATRQRLTPAVRAEVGRLMELFLVAQFDGYRGLRSLKLAAALPLDGDGVNG